jgi:hypothetical protein
MPSLQVVDLSERPADKPEPTEVQRFISEFKQYNQNRREGDEIQKLTDSYLKNKNQEGAWEKLQFDLMNNKEIGPTKKLETQQQLNEMHKQIMENRKTQAEAYKKTVDEALKDPEIQNLVSQGWPVEEAIQYKAAPPSVKNRLMANHLDQVSRGLRKNPSAEQPVEPEAPLEDVPPEEWPELPQPKNMNYNQRVEWENKNQAANNKELQSVRAKNKGLQATGLLVKSMTNLNESKKLPTKLASLIIDPESGGVRDSAQLTGIVNKETQLYAKNLAQFIKGAKDVFGARVSNFEVGAFINQLPSLLNSEQGRRLILKQMELTNQLEEVYNKTLEEALKKYSRTGNYADILSIVDQKVKDQSQDIINKLDSVVEASNYLDKMSENPDKFKDTVLMQDPEGKFKAVKKDKVASAPEGWRVY